MLVSWEMNKRICNRYIKDEYSTRELKWINILELCVLIWVDLENKVEWNSKL